MFEIISIPCNVFINRLIIQVVHRFKIGQKLDDIIVFNLVLILIDISTERAQFHFLSPDPTCITHGLVEAVITLRRHRFVRSQPIFLEEFDQLALFARAQNLCQEAGNPHVFHYFEQIDFAIQLLFSIFEQPVVS